MHKYHFDIKINEKNRSNAGTKATEDCRNILIKNGFRDIEIYFIKNALLVPYNIIKLFIRLISYSFTIQRNSFIIVQYPLKGVNNFFSYFIKLLKRKGCKVACIIHDLDSLRIENNKSEVIKEIKRLSVYNAVISHNPAMSRWLRQNGYEGIIEEIILFDYLVNDDNKITASTSSKHNQVAFAGNLGRGNFLPLLIKAKIFFHLNLYGVGFNTGLLKDNDQIKWLGSFNAEQIVREIKGDFGLVWDGDSAEDIKGIMGNYMRYNTPHKTSLYLTAGLPVIVSKNAAIAGFIEESNTGITIKSLTDIHAKLADITAADYSKMKENVLTVRKDLTEGNFLKYAVSSIQQALYN